MEISEGRTPCSAVSAINSLRSPKPRQPVAPAKNTAVTAIVLTIPSRQSMIYVSISPVIAAAKVSQLGILLVRISKVAAVAITTYVKPITASWIII
jgi:hypothetical protein